MKHLSVSLNLRKFRPFRFREFLDTYPRDGRATLYALIVCFAVGIAAGALLIRANADLAQTVTTWTQRILAHRADGFWSVLFGSSVVNLAFLAAAFLAGNFVPGCALAPLIAALRGGAFGLICGCLYREGIAVGILRNLTSFAPTAVLGTLVILLALRESIGFSAALFRATVLSREIDLPGGFHLYCKRFLILLGLSLLPAMLDAAFSVIFM